MWSLWVVLTVKCWERDLTVSNFADSLRLTTRKRLTVWYELTVKYNLIIEYDRLSLTVILEL